MPVPAILAQTPLLTSLQRPRGRLSQDWGLETVQSQGVDPSTLWGRERDGRTSRSTQLGIF